jgi:hypothetical protein
MSVQVHGASNGVPCRLPERFERKYYLAPSEVGVAYGLLRQVCLPARQYPSELIESLYFDTADLDQHERSSSGDYQKDKVRIRWYGEDGNLAGVQNAFLELKTRRGFASTKQRLRFEVPAESLKLANLGRGILPGALLLERLARFGYFPSEMLQPVIRISYWRYRFEDILTEQRVSLDCRIRSTMIMLEPGNGERELELPGAVLEIKGRTMELPPALRGARMLHTDWSRFSKYSACIDAHGEQPGSVGRLSPSGTVVQL